MIVLIPAYEPDDRLVQLVRSIRADHPNWPIVVVDDGSGPRFRDIFRSAASSGCVVLTREVNRGKGAALKHGFEYCQNRFPEMGVVTADCDGQHTAQDIDRVAARLDEPSSGLVLGVRHFAKGTPLRSRFGNQVTRAVFWAATGTRVSDTQTGLRGYPPELLGWALDVRGNRFEYETNVLLEATDAAIDVTEVPIETIYLAGNESSHFRPLVDSVRIYAPLLKFSLSSLAAFGLDFGLVLLVHASSGSLLLAVVSSRIVSSLFNFATNRHLVFHHALERSVASSAARYFAVVALLMAANYSMLWMLVTGIGLPLVLAKLATEGSLFAVSYRMQRRFVFGLNRDPDATPAARALTSVG